MAEVEIELGDRRLTTNEGIDKFIAIQKVFYRNMLALTYAHEDQYWHIFKVDELETSNTFRDTVIASGRIPSEAIYHGYNRWVKGQRYGAD